MVNEFVCLACSARFDNEADFYSHINPCNPVFKMTNGTITVELSEAIQMKRTRWGRFVHRFWELDFGFGLAFMGLVVMNVVLMHHLNLTFGEGIIEGLAFGFAIPRLLK